MSMESDVKESADRLRRIETRLTAYLVKQGEVVGGATVRWAAPEECVVISGHDVLLSKCENAIPAGMIGDVYVRTEDHKYVATIHIGGER